MAKKKPAPKKKHKVKFDYHHSLDSKQPVHSYFELSYASYLVLPRSVLQSMPILWQKKFIASLEELDQTMGWREQLPDAGTYRVTLEDISEEPRPKSKKSKVAQLLELQEQLLPTIYQLADDEDLMIASRVHRDPFLAYERGRRKIEPRNSSLFKKLLKNEEEEEKTTSKKNTAIVPTKTPQVVCADLETAHAKWPWDSKHKYWCLNSNGYYRRCAQKPHEIKQTTLGKAGTYWHVKGIQESFGFVDNPRMLCIWGKRPSNAVIKKEA